MYPKPKTRNEIFRKLFDSLKIVLTETEIFGLTHLSYTEKSFRLSKFKILYSIILTVLYFLIAVYVFLNYLFNKNEGMLMKVTCLIITTFAGTYITTVWINNLVKRQKIVDYLNKILEFDLKLQNEVFLIDYNKERKRSIIHLITRFCILVLFLIFNYIFYIRARDIPMKYELFQIVSHFFGLFLTIFNTSLCYFSTEIISLLKIRCKILNNQLIEIVNFFERNVNIFEKSLAVKEKSLNFGRICTLHHHLYKQIRLFNDIFGLDLLLMFGVSFMTITQSMFFVCILVQSNDINWLTLWYITAVSVIYATEVFYICHICYSTIQEVVFNFFKFFVKIFVLDF